MIIVRLLSPEPVGWLTHHQLYSGLGADIVMESISPMTFGHIGTSLVTISKSASIENRVPWGTHYWDGSRRKAGGPANYQEVGLCVFFSSEGSAPQGLKPRYLGLRSARLKPCPFKTNFPSSELLACSAGESEIRAYAG
jgi:hypothetical protein